MANSSDAVAIRAANEHPANFKKIFGVDKEAFFKNAQGAVNTIGSAGSAFESLGKKVYKASQMTYSKPYANIINDIATGPGKVAEGIDGISNSLTQNLDKFSEQIRLNTQPFSEYVGSTLGTLTGVIQDPLGPNGLGNVATKLINSVSPGFGEKINGLNQSLNLEVLGRLPGQIMSSVDHILTGIRDLLAVPLNVLAEIYHGYQAIMRSISKLINSVMDGFFQLIINFLDSIIPIKSILGLLESISTLANQISGIAGAFNISAITNITGQITGFTDQFSSIINNPLDFVEGLLPANVSGFLNDLQNPQAFIEGLLPAQVSGFIDGLQNPKNLIKQFLPGDLANGFDKIADMTGFGYTGNMGYGFKNSLKAPQKSVLQSIMGSFSNQMGVLGPTLAGQPETPEGYTPQLNAGHNVSGYNEARRVNRNQYESSYKSDGKTETVTAYGVTERRPAQR